jgi:hypothetical protein
MLGELRAHNQNAQAASQKLFEKLELVEDKLTRIADHAPRLAEVEKTLDAHGETLDHHKNLVGRATGAGMAAGVFASFVGWLVK